MTNLTPIFHKCVDIVSLKFHLVPSSDKREPLSKYPYIISDSFAKDCREVYNNLIRLSAFVAQIKPLYLQNNYEYSRYERDFKRLTAEEKNGIDEEFRLKVHQMNEKLKFFRAYETKRNQLFDALRQERRGFLSLFGDDLEDEEVIYNMNLSSHRAQMILFLNSMTYRCNSSFEKMQRQRYERERQLNLLHFQNLNDDDLGTYDNYKSILKLEGMDPENEISGGETKAFDGVSEELLQELTQENQQLLLSKENQFKQVEKLHTSMVDIVKLQAELTMHLEVQGEQIGNLIDNQSQIELDLRQGNQTLAKATERNKRGSNLIVATCITLGFLLLFIDYIS
ncbi:hypothetical protein METBISCDRAFT_14438 [Metschnikowia bicuspidata]|uniref:t-SNARE coiled-coil homology domain-containing protein n=1 Tax=Metschnikowia bicuspidata TaxID=27322 RepID=A0A4P9ZFL4_9ASCO|nr:hypothetical protein METBISCDRAFT_14438 [Metschnikowia bicuspidata]